MFPVHFYPPDLLSVARQYTRIETTSRDRGRAMADLRKIPADEFARRLKSMAGDDDKHFVFFLGAGCSVSSGIPTAGQLVKDHWLPKLRDLRAPDRKDIDVWAQGHFDRYNGSNAAAFYGPVIEQLFLYPQDRQ